MERFREEIDEILSDVPNEAEKAFLQGYNSPSFRLTVQAVNAKEIREELKEAVNTLSTEDFTAWALMNLSPYSDALTLAEANFATVKHNIKVVFRTGD
jgi:hypothetical protein